MAAAAARLNLGSVTDGTTQAGRIHMLHVQADRARALGGISMVNLYPFTDPRESEVKAHKTMVSGQGCHVTDSEGRVYLDAAAGLWCASLGFDNPRLIAAAVKQLERLPYYHSFMGRTAQPLPELTQRLAAKLPADLSHLFFACSGSEAVDTSIKLAHYYQNARGKTDKKKIIAREGAYHGSGMVSGGLTAMSYCHDGFDLPGPLILRTGRPHYSGDCEPGENESAFAKRRARELDALIRKADPGTVGAFIGEPAMGSGGVILPPEGYWEEVQNVLLKHDVLLIADEIITGFGRTGQWFGCETYHIRPDMMTMAKQLSGAYFPISAVAFTDQLYETIADAAHGFGTFGHGFTYGGHPLGAAIALEALSIYEEMDLPAHVASRSQRLRRALAPLGRLPAVAEVRSVGLMAGVELRSAPDQVWPNGSEVGKEAENRGLLVRVIKDTLAISPPLIVAEEEIDHIADILYDSIVAATAAVRTA